MVDRIINHCEFCNKDLEFNTKLALIHKMEIGNISKYNGISYRTISGIRESHLVGICPECRKIVTVAQVYQKMFEIIGRDEVKIISKPLFNQKEFVEEVLGKPKIPASIMNEYYTLVDFPSPRPPHIEWKLCQLEQDINALLKEGFEKPSFKKTDLFGQVAGTISIQ